MILNYLVYIYDKLGIFLERVGEKIIVCMALGIAKPLIFFIQLPDKIREKVAKIREENKVIFTEEM